MNIKRIFGAVLTVLGIIAICYGAYLFMNNKKEWSNSIIIFVVGGVFFSAGIGLIKTTSDDSNR